MEVVADADADIYLDSDVEIVEDADVDSEVVVVAETRAGINASPSMEASRPSAWDEGAESQAIPDTQSEASQPAPPVADSPAGIAAAAKTNPMGDPETDSTAPARAGHQASSEAEIGEDAAPAQHAYLAPQPGAVEAADALADALHGGSVEQEASGFSVRPQADVVERQGGQGCPAAGSPCGSFCREQQQFGKQQGKRC